MPKTHCQGLLRKSLLILSIAAAALLAPVAAASAHDVLTGTTPQAGETVGDVPDALELTFSNNPLAMGSAITVQDSAGQNWAIGDVRIVDNTVSQGIRPDAPAGEYTVSWRVVSSDAHPIEGTFGFTATAGGEGLPSESPASAADGTGDAEAAAAEPAFPTVTVILVAVAVMAVLIAVIAFFVRILVRRRSA